MLKRGMKTGELPDAMRRFAASVAAGDAAYAAMEGILRRVSPHIAGHVSGTPNRHKHLPTPPSPMND